MYLPIFTNNIWSYLLWSPRNFVRTLFGECDDRSGVHMSTTNGPRLSGQVVVPFLDVNMSTALYSY